MEKVTPFLIFQGNAEEAINYYTSLIEASEITSITRYGANEAGEAQTAGPPLTAVMTMLQG